MSAPERRPQDVAIRFRNGAVIPCDLAYLGQNMYPDDDGSLCHGWRVLNEGPFDWREGDKLLVGSYPPGNHYVEVPGTGPKDAPDLVVPVPEEQP
jgi:hypothetical protein